MNRTYIFKKYQMIASHVGELSKETVLRFFDRYVARAASHRQKLSVQVFSKNHSGRMGEAVPGDVVLVSDPVEFKRGMPLFSLAETVDVDHMKAELENSD